MSRARSSHRAPILAALCLSIGLATPGWAQSPEDLMATYRDRCTSEAHREAAREGATEALDHGTMCDDLAKRIQEGAGHRGTGAKASPLARPDPRVDPNAGPGLGTPGQ